MAQFIESLESRRLLSGTSAIGVLQTDGKALSADVKALGKSGVANLKIIQADVKAGANAKASKAALKTLGADSKSGVAALSKHTSKTVSLITRDVKKGEASVKQLLKKPGNAALGAKLGAAIAALNADAAAGQTAIEADLAALNATGSVNYAALEAVDVGDTKLTTDVSNTVVPSNTAAETAISTAASTALVTDVAAVVAEANAVL